VSDPFEDFYDEIDNFGSEYSKFIHPREFGERWVLLRVHIREGIRTVGPHSL